MKARWETNGPSPFRGGLGMIDSCAMKLEPAIFDVPDEADDARREAQAVADVEAGRVISHEAMKAWLLSWGKPDELPPPQVGD